MNLLDNEDVDGFEYLNPDKTDKTVHMSITQKLNKIDKVRESRMSKLNKESMVMNDQSDESVDLEMESQHGEQEEMEYLKQQAMKKYESLDYEITRNEPFYNQQYSMLGSYESYFYLNLLFIGFLVGVAGWVLDWGMAYFFQIKDNIFSDYYTNGFSDDTWMGVLYYMLISIAYGLVTCVCIVFWFGGASGGGIAEIKAYLNGVNYMNLTTMSTGISKLILTMFAVASGLYVGIEAPMIHVGAVIGAVMANMPYMDYWFPNSTFYYRFRNDHNKRDFLSCGAAAGVVAGFLSPLGGIMFAIEEASTFWTIKMTLRTFFVSMVCAITTYYCKAFQMNEFYIYYLVRFANFPDAPLFNMNEFPVMAVLGVIMGLLGGFWNILSKKMMHFRFYYIFGYKRYRILEVIVLVIISAGLRVLMPIIFDTCYEVTPDYTCNMTTLSTMIKELSSEKVSDLINDSSICQPVNFWAQFNCPVGYYNPVATLWYTEYNQMFEALFHNMNTYGLLNLTYFAVSTYLLVALCNFTAVPMGLFMPAMTIGAAVGRLYIEAIRMWFGIQTFEYFNPGFYALLGAAGMISGVTRLMLTVIVIFYEITNRATTCVPLMIVTLLAKYVGDYLSIGIYDIMMEIRTIPYVELDPHYNVKKKIKAKEIMSKPVVTLREVEKVSVILEHLQATTHNGFPTISCEDGVFNGLMLRNNIAIMLKKSYWFTYPFSLTEEEEYTKVKEYLLFNKENATVNRPILHYNEFTKNYESKSVYIDYEEYKYLAKDLYLDFRPYINKGAMCLNENSPIERVFELFRALGIRHLTITSPLNIVKGIITRKDIMSDFSRSLN